jgi:hypothetical protein
MSNLYRGPSNDAPYQVSIQLVERFQRRRLKCEKLTDDGCQKLTLPLARLYFSHNFTDIDECASTPCDKNAACNNTDGSFTCICKTGYSGDGFNCTGKIIGLNIVQIIILLWNEGQNLQFYTGPSIDASYQVSVHLAKGFQRGRLKCEKLTDDRRQKLTLLE